MEEKEHYLRAMLEELNFFLNIIRQGKQGEESLKIQNEVIENFYKKYKERFEIESIDSIKDILKDIEGRRKKEDSEQER